MTVATKICRECKTDKPITDFHRCASSADKRQYLCKPCAHAASTAYARANREKVNKNRRTRNRAIREEALRVYGGDPPRCVCCGEDRYEFLCFDHPENDGAEHRRMMRTPEFARWAKRDGWPPGFRVLCHNCNIARGVYGFCPHEVETPESRELAPLAGAVENGA